MEKNPPVTLKSAPFLSWLISGEICSVSLSHRIASPPLNCLQLALTCCLQLDCFIVKLFATEEKQRQNKTPGWLCSSHRPSLSPWLPSHVGQRWEENMGSSFLVAGPKVHKTKEGCKGSRGLSEPSCTMPANPPAGLRHTKGLFSWNSTCKFCSRGRVVI